MLGLLLGLCLGLLLLVKEVVVGGCVFGGVASFEGGFGVGVGSGEFGGGGEGSGGGEAVFGGLAGEALVVEADFLELLSPEPLLIFFELDLVEVVLEGDHRRVWFLFEVLVHDQVGDVPGLESHGFSGVPAEVVPLEGGELLLELAGLAEFPGVEGGGVAGRDWGLGFFGGGGVGLFAVEGERGVVFVLAESWVLERFCFI